MSYDLYFTAPPHTREQFAAYFGKRLRYELQGDQAWYSNPVTGVYFSFDFNDHPPESEEDIEHWALFTINLFRPHYFILEAEPEVSAFVREFQPSINDPQSAGMGKNAYTPEGLLRGWNHANEFGYNAMLRRQDRAEPVYSKPTRELEEIWQWNFLRDARTESIRKDLFIPRIIFGLIHEKLASFCVWPDAISTLIPKVDYLWIPRAALAPKTLLRQATEDKCLIPFAVAMVAIENYRVSGYEMDTFELPSPDTPAALKKFVRGLRPDSGKPLGIGMDNVLNRELVQRYRPSPLEF